MEVLRVVPPKLTLTRLDTIANNAAVEHPFLRKLAVRHVPHLPFALGSPYATDKQLAKLVKHYWDEDEQGMSRLRMDYKFPTMYLSVHAFDVFVPRFAVHDPTSDGEPRFLLYDLRDHVEGCHMLFFTSDHTARFFDAETPIPIRNGFAGLAAYDFVDTEALKPLRLPPRPAPSPHPEADVDLPREEILQYLPQLCLQDRVRLRSGSRVRATDEGYAELEVAPDLWLWLGW